MKKPTANKQIGNWLKKKREEAGQSQAQLAMVIGRSKSFIGRYEGGGMLDSEEFVKIAHVLKANPHEIVERLDSQKIRI